MSADLATALLALERELLTPQVHGSEQRIYELLADDFVEFGSSGRIFDRKAIIDEFLESPAGEDYSIEDFRLVASNGTTAFVTYCCVARSASGETIRKSNRSSLWRIAGDHWQLLFHQGTIST